MPVAISPLHCGGDGGAYAIDRCMTPMTSLLEAMEGPMQSMGLEEGLEEGLKTSWLELTYLYFLRSTC